MSELNDLTLLQVQKRLKPKIEDVIPLILDGDSKKNAFNFVEWLRENKMSPGWGGIHNSWYANCKGKSICRIGLRNDGSWGFMLYLGNIKKYEQSILEEGLQSVVWQMLIRCRGGCEAKCPPGSDLTIFGKEFKNLCNDKYVTLSRFWISISNPDKVAVLKIKRLLELEQKARKGEII